MDFTGKRVLITGGSRGIGKACAEGFAKRGAKVAINYVRNKDAAHLTLAGLPGEGHILAQADVSDPNAIEGLIAETVKGLGGLNIVVNNAGISQKHPINDVSYEEWQASWDRILSVNLRAPANVIYWATQYFLKNGGGRIVNVSSRGAFRGEPEMPAYGASKAGLNAMSQSLAQKLAPNNIYLGVVAPGFVETEMVTHVLESERGEGIRNQSPLGRVAQPEEVAYAVIFLAAEESKFSTGTIIDVNGASYLRG
ncbi:MAG: SDR family oxidoreductase [Anaerolineae bacterium]|jgi:NAD(P)-dependent dehydrogenase (short-subunit alcohol dehydrogenase family)|nr:SDR family oxidoreductase [Anaerolineae bacterium]MBT7191998.1 SDR family oxidoreductase [Anaerolineae bacterium]MBT7992178.1 SDR family oxidoreductase [Anaerolineae bacterium]